MKKRQSITRALIAAALTVGLIGSPVTLTAHKGATGIVKERMDAMGGMQKAMKALYAMLSGKAAMDKPAAIAHAETIRSQSGERMTRLFPEGSIKGPSEALQAVWNNWADFKAQADGLERDAAALAAAFGGDADRADPEHLFRALAAACKACHKDYRKPR